MLSRTRLGVSLRRLGDSLSQEFGASLCHAFECLSLSGAG